MCLDLLHVFVSDGIGAFARVLFFDTVKIPSCVRGVLKAPSCLTIRDNLQLASVSLTGNKSTLLLVNRALHGNDCKIVISILA